MRSRADVALLALCLAGQCGQAVLAQDPPALEYVDQSELTPLNRSSIITSDGLNYWDFQFADTVFDAIVFQDVGEDEEMIPRFKEVVFAFNQCFGGGMIDDLKGLGLAPASYTSAAAHSELSRARSEDLVSGNDPNAGDLYRRVESTYNLRWAPAVNNPNATVKDAATTGRAEDIIGPFKRDTTVDDTRFLFGNPPDRATSPQYTSSGEPGDAIRLHEGAGVGTKFRAILFGGQTQLDRGPVLRVGDLVNDNPATAAPEQLSNYYSTPNPDPLKGPIYFHDLAVNYNTLLRVRENLLGLGYTDDEMWIMYPGGPTGKLYEDGPNIPDWVDAGTTFDDLDAAWRTWMKSETDENTQILFWSNWGHGGTMTDARAQEDAQGQPVRIPRGDFISFPMDSDLSETLLDVFNYYKNGVANPPDGGDPMPYFEVDTTLLVTDLSIELNGRTLTQIEYRPDPAVPGSWRYKFELSREDLLKLNSRTQVGTQQDIVVNYNSLGPEYDQFADFITLMGPTAGNFANGLSMRFSVPEPSSWFMITLVGLLFFNHRARSVC